MNLTQFNPKCIFEIGVGDPSISRAAPYMGSDVKLVLFEPHRDTCARLHRAFGHHANLTIHNVALFDRDGEIEFALNGDSSYVTEVLSPTINDGPIEWVESRPKTTVPCRTIDHYDHGQIDVALIDTEGCEWKVLSRMVSRPKVICLETHNTNQTNPYKTPDLVQIERFMQENGYQLIERDVGDSWYVRREGSA